MNPSLRGNALKSGRFLVLFALLVLLVLVRNERHHHVLVPAPVRGVGVGRGAGAVTPRGQYSVTLYTVVNQGSQYSFSQKQSSWCLESIK